MGSTLVTRLGGSIGLTRSRPSSVEKLGQRLVGHEDEDDAIVFHAQSDACTSRNHFHESFLLALRVEGDARSTRRAQQQYVRSHVVEDRIPGRFFNFTLGCR